MKSNNRELYIKFLLIMVSEAVAIVLTNLVSKYIVPIHHTSLSYVLCGAALAVAVVVLYDKWSHKQRNRIRKELKEITDAALMRYDISDKD